MRIRYVCTRKPFHMTHIIETDEPKEEIENPIRCTFCGADMRLEILSEGIMKQIQIKYMILLITFGIINPILIASDRHGIVVALFGSIAWIIFLFGVIMYALTYYYTEKELLLTLKSKFKLRK